MGDSTSLINLEGVSKPLTRLIEVLAGGIGTLYAPFGTVRQARADARAKIIHAEADAEVANLAVRAMSRLEYREALRQENVERIATVAAGELPESVPEEKPSQDWVLQFLDSAQDVCDEEMQRLWGRILAGEIAAPKSFGKRTLQCLRTIEKWEAEGFTKLCSFAVTGDDGWPYLILEEVTFNEMAEAISPGGVIEHFVSIGLLMAESSIPSASAITGRGANYFDTKYVLQGPPKPDGKYLEDFIECRSFTSVGKQLAKIAGATKRDGYIERLSDHMTRRCKVSISRRGEEPPPPGGPSGEP